MGLYNLNYSERLKSLNLRSLEIRRQLKVLRTLYRIKNNKYTTLSRLKVRYNFVETRNGSKIVKPYNRINFCDKNFLIYSIDLFNSLLKGINDEEKM